MAVESTQSEPRSRRAILGATIGGLAALLGGRFASPDRASAAAGDPLIMGAANDAGATNTSVATASTGTALLVTQNGAGTALRGSAVGVGSIAGFFTANNGTGISGVTGAPGSYGVFAANNGTAGSAGALRANGGNNHGIVASTGNAAKYALSAISVASGTAINASGGEIGVRGEGTRGVEGRTSNAAATAGGAVGVWGHAGVTGTNNMGVLGEVNSPLGFGVAGLNFANASSSYGVLGQTFGSVNGATGVRGVDNGGTTITNGVYGTSTSTSGNGVFGSASSGSVNSFAVYGEGAGASFGVVGASSTGIAVQALGNAAVSGNLAVTGTLSKGMGSFKIDHPLDPANKFLYHSFVESPDMKNVYDGLVTLDARGEATVRLPGYFDALNRDVRYQLTSIGRAAPNLHVKSKASGNAFSIGGGNAGQEVSWLVTGIRQDAYARAHPIVPEMAKTGSEKGRYLHPAENGVAMSKAIDAAVTTRR